MSQQPLSPAARRKERRAFARGVGKAIPALVKGSGWRSKYGWPYREQAGWFIHQQHSTSHEAAKTTVSLYAKPMAVDELFWDIAGMPGNKSEALSLRMVGAFACHAPALFNVEILEGDNAEETAAKVVEHVQLWAETFEAAVALEQLWAALDPHKWAHLPHRPNGDAYTCLLVLSRRTDEAISFCEDRISAKDSGGFPNIGRDRKGFYPSAIQWLQSEFDPSIYPPFTTTADHSTPLSA